MKSDEELNKNIGIRIKKLRETKKEYQKETVYKLKKYGIYISEGALGTYEKGIRKVPPNTIIALAKHFDVTTDYLLGLTNKPKGDILDNHLEIVASTRDNVDISELPEREKEIIRNIIRTSKGE